MLLVSAKETGCKGIEAKTADHSRRHLLISDKSRFIADAKYHKELIKYIIEHLNF